MTVIPVELDLLSPPPSPLPHPTLSLSVLLPLPLGSARCGWDARSGRTPRPRCKEIVFVVKCYLWQCCYFFFIPGRTRSSWRLRPCGGAWTSRGMLHASLTYMWSCPLKTIDYSQAFCSKSRSLFVAFLLLTGRCYEAEICTIYSF